MTTKTKKPAKPTPTQAWIDEIKKPIKSKAEKQVVDDFAASIATLIATFGKAAALSLYTKAGMLITLAKDEAAKP